MGRVIEFDSCGHCPLARVELRNKCEPMRVYCPLQHEGNSSVNKLVYETGYIGSLHPDCPLPTREQWNGQVGKTDNPDFVAHVQRCRYQYQFGPGYLSESELKEAMPNMAEGQKRIYLAKAALLEAVTVS